MEGKQTVMCETIVKRKRMCFQPGFESISRACHPNVQIIPEELSLVGKGSTIKGVLVKSRNGRVTSMKGT